MLFSEEWYQLEQKFSLKFLEDLVTCAICLYFSAHLNSAKHFSIWINTLKHYYIRWMLVPISESVSVVKC